MRSEKRSRLSSRTSNAICQLTEPHIKSFLCQANVISPNWLVYNFERVAGPTNFLLLCTSLQTRAYSFNNHAWIEAKKHVFKNCRKRDSSVKIERQCSFRKRRPVASLNERFSWEKFEVFADRAFAHFSDLATKWHRSQTHNCLAEKCIFEEKEVWREKEIYREK